MNGYSDDQLGAGEGGRDGAEGVCPETKQTEYDTVMLQTAVEDFERNFMETTAL